MLYYAILVKTYDGYLWLDILKEYGTRFFYHEDFNDAYLFDDFKAASLLCDTLNAIDESFGYKVCSVNVIIDDPINMIIDDEQQD